MAELGPLRHIEDPRTPLDRARRVELFEFAKAKGVSEIFPDMPAQMMRRILIARGVTDIRVPNRLLGMQGRTVIAPNEVTRGGNNRVLERTPHEAPAENIEVSADDELIRNYLAEKQQQSKQPTAKKPKAEKAPKEKKPKKAKAPREKKPRESKGPTLAELRAECKRRGLKQPRGASAALLKELLANGGNAS